MSVTIFLIVIIILVSVLGFKKPQIQYSLLLHPVTFWRKKRYYQILTSGFVHADTIHLLFNMYVLWMFWSIVETAFGMIFGNIWVYPLLFLSGVIVANIPWIFSHKNNPHYSTLGASGGVSSIVFASIILLPTAKMGIIFLPIMIPGYIFWILYLLYCIYQDHRGGSNINHMAHFVGAIWGIIFLLIFWSETIPNFVSQLYVS